MKPALLGAVEAGGTKFVCGVGTSISPELVAETTIPTGHPQETIGQVAEFFRSVSGPVEAIGIGTFGPVQIDPDHPEFGHITSTPKPGWRYFDIRGSLQRALSVPVGLDTDVNAAALGEGRWGAAKGLGSYLYVTVGTGVGGGAIVDGKAFHGMTRPEMGHIRIPHDLKRDPFTGSCPFHGDCLEGLVCGPALGHRWGTSPQNLPDDHPAWELQVEYLALACMNWIFTLSPGRIVLGGGLMRPHLFPSLRERVAVLNHEYLHTPAITDNAQQYIVPSTLAGRAGLLGAIEIASRQLKRT